MFLNARSIKTCTGDKNELLSLKHMLAVDKPAIFIINETWLNCTVNDSELEVNEYVFFRKDRPNGRGGGLLIYVRNDIYCTRNIDLEINNLVHNEIIVLDIKLSNLP